MKCAACGAELAEGTQFCPQCGHTVEGANVIEQGAGYQQGTNYGQGAGYQQGTNYGQGTGYQQGPGYNYQQDTGYQQGANYGQGTGYQQGSGYNYQQGTGYDYQQGMPSGPMTKKEFYNLPGVKSCRTNIRTCAILIYICGGITILASLLLSDYLMSSILDGLLLVGLGLWLQLGRSRVAAIIIAAYGVFNMVIALVTMGQIQGWLIPLAGIYAIIYTFKFGKMWDNYTKNGVMP